MKFALPKIRYNPTHTAELAELATVNYDRCISCRLQLYEQKFYGQWTVRCGLEVKIFCSLLLFARVLPQDK